MHIKVMLKCDQPWFASKYIDTQKFTMKTWFDKTGMLMETQFEVSQMGVPNIPGGAKTPTRVKVLFLVQISSLLCCSV